MSLPSFFKKYGAAFVIVDTVAILLIVGYVLNRGQDAPRAPQEKNIPTGVPDGACRPTGCSGQVCADKDVATTCEWKEEYACYTKADCERQNSGECGWTRTKKFEECVADALAKNLSLSAPDVADKTDMIRVLNIAPNVIVVSPLYLRGEARGNWFFEASFPAELVDANGKKLANAIATAEGEWMTTEFVPFHAEFRFDTPETETGFVILHKDNPSDDRVQDDELRFPVRFR
ncbi:MAG: Gmad2 immunoglobulin-like domain-containing protein [Patescibacteria group bacterium]